MTAAVVHRLSLYPLTIPMRRTVIDAAGKRRVADPVIVSVELIDGTRGHGETHPQPHLTGETVNTILESIRSVFIPAIMNFNAESFPEALELIEALPWTDADGRPIPAARSAVELALLDSSMRTFRRALDDVISWMGAPVLTAPAGRNTVRFTGLLNADTPATTRRLLRRMYRRGLRDFKVRVGFDGDRDHFAQVRRYLRRPLRAQRASLRLDAAGAWSPREARNWLSDVGDVPIAAIEQPLARGREDELPALRQTIGLPLVVSDSLMTLEDARRLIDIGAADVFDLQITRCGGLLPVLRFAAAARRAGIGLQLGARPGQTSLLSAAGLRLIAAGPALRWAEGCFGTDVLREDLAARSLRLGYAGRPPRLSAPGLGFDPDPQRLERLCAGDPIVLRF